MNRKTHLLLGYLVTRSVFIVVSCLVALLLMALLQKARGDGFPPMPLSAPVVETNEPASYTLQLEWPTTGETNRVMVDGVQRTLAWTNATVTVAPGFRCISIITLSGRHPYSHRGDVGWLPGEYRGVRYKVFSGGTWTPWLPWTNPPGTKLLQTAPPHLFEPHIEPPKQAWVRRPDFPLP